jgi:glutaredoxin 3
MGPKVVMYATAWCPFCQMAERLLRQKGVELETIRVDLEPQRHIEMMERTQRRTVPQIYVDDYHVGGYDDLCELDREGRLDRLLRGKEESI